MKPLTWNKMKQENIAKYSNVRVRGNDELRFSKEMAVFWGLYPLVRV